MSGESPVVELYDSDGNPFAIQNGAVIPANTPTLIIGGSDGINARYLLIDSSGRQITVGAGTAGTPAGGVLSIQGVSGGQAVPISGAISASQTGNIDAGNSSTSPLSGSGTFAGTGIDVSSYGVISVFVFTDQAGTLNIEFSTDNSNWDDVISYSISASIAEHVQIGPQARYFRVVYQNGSSAQSVFRLQTIEKTIIAFHPVIPVSSVVDSSADALLTKSVITGKTTGGGGAYVDVKVSPSGTLTVDASNSTNVGITGTVTSNQGTSPWITNITQFGGNNIVTGTGTSGVGIPRVTVSNDSNILATQSGSWTVTGNQGTPNTLSNKWPVQITDGTNTMPTGDTVGRAIFEKITDGTNTAIVTAAGAIKIDGSAVTQPVSGTVTANQGTAAALSGYWPVRITDGTNTMPTGDTVGRAIFEKITDGTNTVAVKAASTAAAAADPSLVTAFSPNSPLPTGSNTIGAVTQASGPWTENITQIAGSAISTSATGVQKVGVVGNAGATTDATLTVGTAPTNGYGTLAQYNTSQPSPTNNQTVSLQSDQSGNLLQFPGVQTKTGAIWNSSTTINTLQYPTGTATIGAPVGSTSILIQLDQTTTITGGAVTFQGTYDGINWVTIPTSQILHPQTFVQLTNPYTFVANTNQPFLIQLQGFQQIRLNLTTLITGTGSITPYWTALSNPPAQVVTIASGFNTVQGVAADGAAVSGNPVLVGGFDGTNTQTILTDTSGRIVIAPSGASTTSGFSFGDVALSSITTSVVRRTTYTEQSSNAQRSIVSSNVNDTSAGTGARQVKITYYDSTGAGPNTETVNLNGTTFVATSNSNICFIEKMEVVSVGSGGVNAGTITLFVNNAGGGGTIGTIAIGDNRTFWAHHYTPNGKTTFVTSVSVVINGGAGIFILKAKTLNLATAPEAQVSDFVRESAQAATSTRNYGTPIQVVGPARILMYVTTEANTSLTYRGAFDYYDQ